MPMIHPAARLRAVAQLANALADTWTLYEQTEATLSAPVMAAAGGGRSNPGGGRGSDIPDPTAGVASSHERYYRTASEIDEAMGLLRIAQDRVNHVIRHHSAIASQIDAAARALRCSGAVDPLCVNNAVRESGENAGLCWKCIKRKQREQST